MLAVGLAADALAARAGDLLGAVAGDFAVTWQPTTIPFLLRNGGVAVLLVGALAWRGMTRGLPGWLRPVAAVGRMSLSHYLGHVLLVFAPLRLWWPDEGWGMAVGVGAALGYVSFALAVVGVVVRPRSAARAARSVARPRQRAVALRRAAPRARR